MTSLRLVAENAAKRTKAVLDAKNQKAKTKELTANNLLTVFLCAYRSHYGQSAPVLLTEDTKKKVTGLVKMAKKEGEDSGKFLYAVVEDMVTFWDDIRQKEAYTLNGKPWKLSAYPNLKDFVVCREFFMSALAEIQENKKLEKDGTPVVPRSLF